MKLLLIENNRFCLTEGLNTSFFTTKYPLWFYSAHTKFKGLFCSQKPRF